MNLLRRLMPEFLLRFDDEHRMRNPRLWATKWHYHIWFLLLVNALVFATAMLLPVHLYRAMEPEFMFNMLIVFDVVYLCFWVYRSVLFNVEKRHGLRGKWQEPWEFLVQMVSIMLIMSISYTMGLTLSQRIDKTISDRDFLDDMHTLNEGAPYFLHGCCNWYYTSNEDGVSHDRSSVSHYTRNEQFHFFRSLEEYTHRDSIRKHSRGHYVPLQDIYERYASAADQFDDPYEASIHDPDSMAYYRALADSIAERFPLFYMSHAYFSEYPIFHDSLETMHELDSMYEKRYIEHLDDSDAVHLARIERFIRTSQKYVAHKVEIDPELVLTALRQKEPLEISSNVFAAALNRINDAKTMNYEFASFGAFMVVLIIGFYIALLLSIFKNMYWQPFLIAVVTGFVVPIVVLLAVLILDEWLHISDEEDIMIWSNYIIGLGLILLVFAFKSQVVYRTRTAVMAILANVMWPIAALITLFMLQEYFDVFGIQALDQQIRALFPYNDTRFLDPVYIQMNEELEHLRSVCYVWMTCVFYGGLVLYVALIHPYFRKVYTRLWSLPELK